MKCCLPPINIHHLLQRAVSRGLVTPLDAAGTFSREITRRSSTFFQSSSNHGGSSRVLRNRARETISRSYSSGVFLPPLLLTRPYFSRLSPLPPRFVFRFNEEVASLAEVAEEKHEARKRGANQRGNEDEEEGEATSRRVLFTERKSLDFALHPRVSSNACVQTRCPHEDHPTASVCACDDKAAHTLPDVAGSSRNVGAARV